MRREHCLFCPAARGVRGVNAHQGVLGSPQNLGANVTDAPRFVVAFGSGKEAILPGHYIEAGTSCDVVATLAHPLQPFEVSIWILPHGVWSVVRCLCAQCVTNAFCLDLD